MDFGFGQFTLNEAFGAITAAGTFVSGILIGRAGAKKTIAEAEKIQMETVRIQAETRKLLDDQAVTAENRLHDQILASFGKLAELYEKNLESMKSTIDNMDREIAELRAENEHLTRTVGELTADKEQLRRTVDDLRSNIDRLIQALRNGEDRCADDPAIAPLLTGVDWRQSPNKS